jgi:hypothetical protein
MVKKEIICSNVNDLFNVNPKISKWTVRQLYYRLVASNTIPNTKSSYTQFDNQLTRLRERGDVSDEKFVDNARRIIEVNDKQEYIDEYFQKVMDELGFQDEFFTTSRWDNQRFNIIAVVEKDALSSLVSDVTMKYRVPLAIGKGYSSRTQILQIVKRYNNNKENLILYLGDFDPSGLDIERSLNDRLNYEAVNFTISRIQLNMDTVKALNLPPNPAKVTDPRSKSYLTKYGDNSWELDAIPPLQLQKFTEDAIEGYIDWDEWENSIAEEEQGKAELKDKFNDAMNTLKEKFTN